MGGLRVAAGLSLPVDVVTQPIAILARRGAGKTYTATVIVEEVIRAKVPVVVLDPTGAWWGLRTSADGDRPGLPVVIFGGDHGDVPLEPTAGRVIADVVLEHPGAYVVDLSGFESKAAEQRFAADFLERLYRGKRRETGPLLLVVDEADVFAPQRPGPGGEQLRTLGATEAIVRRGRIKGLGDLLISQRAAVLNKNVLTQTEVLIVMQTTGPQDRAAIDEWIAGNGTREERDEVLSSLASLERGEAWLWSPAYLRMLRRIRIRARTTFDSSRTPEAGETAIAPRAFAKVDLDALGERIAATREQAKANDPAELRRRIAALERQLASVPTATPAPEVRVERVEVPVLNGQVDTLAGLVVGLRGLGDQLADVGVRILDAADGITAAIDRVAAAPRSAQGQGVPPVATPGLSGLPGRTAAPTLARPETGPREASGTSSTQVSTTGSRQSAAETGEDRPLDAGARRMLVALARLHPTPLLRSQLGTLADVAWTSGTFRGYLSRLRTSGLIEEPDRNVVALSVAGVERMAGQLGTGAPSVEDLVDMWNRKLDAGARRMLRILVDRHPEWTARDLLGELAEIAHTSGTFRGYLSRLRVNRLIEEAGQDVRAGEALFLGTGR
jgi:hypothetical protein